MKRLLVTIVALILIDCAVSAQQILLFSQYVENSFLLNPAVAGSRVYSPIRLSIRQQWAGIDGAPKTQALSYNTNFGSTNNTCHVSGNPFAYRSNDTGVGLGGYIFKDSYGSISRIGVELSYAYHLRLTRGKFGKSITRLSFGLGGLLYQYKFDGTGIPSNDPLYVGVSETSYVPDANVGIYLYNNNYFVGVSTAHLFQSSIRLGDGSNSINDNSVKRHVYVMGGYTFHLSRFVDLEPSLIARKTFGYGNYLDILTKVYVRDYWLALSYRFNNQYVGMIGLNFDRFYFGYSYDYYTNNLVATGSNGTHEVTLGVNFR